MCSPCQLIISSLLSLAVISRGFNSGNGKCEVQTQRVSPKSDFPRPKRGKNSRISGGGRAIGWGGRAIGWTSWPVREGGVGGITVAFNGCQMSQKIAQRNAKRIDRSVLGYVYSAQNRVSQADRGSRSVLLTNMLARWGWRRKNRGGPGCKR